MYLLLTPTARQETTAEQFAGYYRDLREVTGLQRLTVEVTSSLVTGDTAQVGYRKTLFTDRFGTIEESQSVSLVLQGRDWLVQWSPSLVLGPLTPGSRLSVEESDNLRGAIYDRAGRPLAVLGTRVVVGVVPGEISDEDTLLSVLSRVLDRERADVREAYAKALRPDWFMPVGEMAAEAAQEHYAELNSLPGVLLRERAIRYYPEAAVSSHLTGYVGVVAPDQLNEMRAQGYREDDVVGQAGLEEAFEAQLAGRRGARLLVLGPSGEVRAVAAERPAEASRNLYTTIDLPLQSLAASLLQGQRGAIVALDPRNGEVLALASSPSFDANAMVAGMSETDWQGLLDDEGRPLVNRATQAELPPGSVFKVVTESAALQANLFLPTSTFFCPGTWSGLGTSWTVRCWLPSGHGTLTLAEGLTHSCNSVFAEVGKQLDGWDRDQLPRFALEYGFGARSGLVGVPEATGLVPDSAWKQRALGEAWFPGDTVNFAIGQGQLLVTPLQVAGMIAAVAANGTRYRPRLLLSLGSPGSDGSESAQPEIVGQLPLAPEHLDSIRQSLFEGCMTPAGTAYNALGSMSMDVSGKTGTAENPGEAPHAWFAGYAPTEDPRIAVAVLLENGGQGSLVAAPIFRSLIEDYFQ